MSRKRKIIVRSKTEDNPMPQDLFSNERQPDSTHVLMCPACKLKVYVGDAFTKAIEKAKQAVGSSASLPQHTECNALMQMIPIDADEGQFYEAMKRWKTWDEIKRSLES